MKNYKELQIEVIEETDDVIRTSEIGGVELPEVPIDGVFGNTTFGQNE